MRRTVTGFATLGAAVLFAQILGFFVLAVIARRLGPSDLGAFSFALNLAGYFAIPANFGITALATRDLARDPERLRPLLGEVAALQGGLSLLPYLVLVALAPVLAVDETSRGLIPIVGLTFVVESASLGWVLFGVQRYATAALARVAGALTFAAFVLVFVHAGDTTPLSWAHIAGVAVTSVLAAVAVLRLSGRPRVEGGIGPMVRRFRAGVPLGLSAVMITIYYTGDSLMLGYMKGTDEVGQYAVAYKIPLAVLAFAALWGGVLFPHASALAERSRKELREQLGYFASLSLVASFPMLAGAVVVADQLIPGLFGAAYAPAATPFVLLMGAAALVVFTINWGTTAVAIGDDRHLAIAVTCGAVANMGANLVVIPPFGMTGAACATVAAEAIVFAYVLVRVNRMLGVVPLDRHRIGRAAAATAAMVAVLVLLVPDGWTAGIKVAIGAAFFTLSALALRVVRLDELRALRARVPATDPETALAVSTLDEP